MVANAKRAHAGLTRQCVLKGFRILQNQRSVQLELLVPVLDMQQGVYFAYIPKPLVSVHSSFRMSEYGAKSCGLVMPDAIRIGVPGARSSEIVYRTGFELSLKTKWNVGRSCVISQVQLPCP